jgi:hypothetical protein
MSAKCYSPYQGITVIEFIDDLKVYIIYSDTDSWLRGRLPLQVLWLLREYSAKGYTSVIRDQIVLLNRKLKEDDYWAEVLIDRYCKEVVGE